MSDMSNNNDHGSFLTGFTFGLFAGAASLFLFGTEKGSRVRSRLAEEWDEAKHYLEEEGVIEKGKTSIRDVFKSIVDNIQEHQSKFKKLPPKNKPKSTTKKVIAKATSAKATPKKFKRAK